MVIRKRPPTPALSPADTQLAFDAAQKVVRTHERLSEWLKPGLTLAQIDAQVARILADLGCKSCFLGYTMGRGPVFPSHACLSVNDCVVHGTAAYITRPMQQGDLLKIDIGVSYKGFIGDAAWTYSFGKPSTEIRRLMDCGKLALAEGVQELRPGNILLAWAKTVQQIVEHEHGYHLVRGLGGHGYGRTLHAPPFVSNVAPSYQGEWNEAYLPCTPGMLLAVEPMIAIGTGKVTQKPKSWPVFSEDGSMSVHYEHDVLITETGPRVLTEGLDQVRDVID